MCYTNLKQHSESISLTMRLGFKAVQQGGGCLDKTHALKPRAFVVALVEPAAANGMLGGKIKGCPHRWGICIVGLHAPDGPM